MNSRMPWDKKPLACGFGLNVDEQRAALLEMQNLEDSRFWIFNIFVTSLFEV